MTAVEVVHKPSWHLVEIFVDGEAYDQWWVDGEGKWKPFRPAVIPVVPERAVVPTDEQVKAFAADYIGNSERIA